jgi:hypothetical protein
MQCTMATLGGLISMGTVNMPMTVAILVATLFVITVTNNINVEVKIGDEVRNEVHHHKH